MASAEEQHTTRRTVRDVMADVCGPCLFWLEDLSEEMSNAQLLHLLPEGVVAEMAEHGHLECLEVALSLGADKAAWDRDRSRHYAPGGHPSELTGSAPVKAAAKKNRADCVQLLIEEGFNICHPHVRKERKFLRVNWFHRPVQDNTETDYSIPICAAAEYRSMSSFDVLFKAHSKQGSMSIAFCYAILDNSKICMRMLIAAGADVNIENNGVTPLMMKNPSDNASLIKMLIEAGADVNRKDSRGATALMHHTYYGNINCITALMKAGAEVNATNDQRETALMFLVKGVGVSRGYTDHHQGRGSVRPNALINIPLI